MRRSLLVVFMFLVSSPSLLAMQVFDSANLAQNMQTTLQSVHQTQQLLQSYQTQLLQYQNMLTNTLNPSAWGFGELQSTLNGFQSLAGSLQSQFSQLQNLQSQLNLDSLLAGGSGANAGGGGDGGGVNWSAVSGSSSLSQALERYGQENVTNYQSAEMSALGRGLQDASIRNVVQLVERQQEDLDGFSQRLQQLTSQAQGAQGLQEALQIQTQVLTMLIELQAQSLALMQAAEMRAAVEEKKKVEEEKRLEALLGEVYRIELPDLDNPPRPFRFPGDE